MSKKKIEKRKTAVAIKNKIGSKKIGTETRKHDNKMHEITYIAGSTIWTS